METIIAIVIGALVKDGMLTAFSTTLITLGYLFYLHKLILQNIPRDTEKMLNDISTLVQNQKDIREQQLTNANKLLLHTKESSDNANNIVTLRDSASKLEGLFTDVKVVKDTVSKVEGMLSIMGLNTSRGIK